MYIADVNRIKKKIKINQRSFLCHLLCSTIEKISFSKEIINLERNLQRNSKNHKEYQSKGQWFGVEKKLLEFLWEWRHDKVRGRSTHLRLKILFNSLAPFLSFLLYHTILGLSNKAFTAATHW